MPRKKTLEEFNNEVVAKLNETKYEPEAHIRCLEYNGQSGASVFIDEKTNIVFNQQTHSFEAGNISKEFSRLKQIDEFNKFVEKRNKEIFESHNIHLICDEYNGNSTKESHFVDTISGVDFWQTAWRFKNRPAIPIALHDIYQCAEFNSSNELAKLNKKIYNCFGMDIELVEWERNYKESRGKKAHYRDKNSGFEFYQGHGDFFLDEIISSDVQNWLKDQDKWIGSKEFEQFSKNTGRTYDSFGSITLQQKHVSNWEKEIEDINKKWFNLLGRQVYAESYKDSRKKRLFYDYTSDTIYSQITSAFMSGQEGCPAYFRGRGLSGGSGFATSNFQELLTCIFEKYFGKEYVKERDNSIFKYENSDRPMEFDIVIENENGDVKYLVDPGAWKYHKDGLYRDIERTKKCNENGISVISIYFFDNLDEQVELLENEEVKKNLENSMNDILVLSCKFGDMNFGKSKSWKNNLSNIVDYIGNCMDIENLSKTIDIDEAIVVAKVRNFEKHNYKIMEELKNSDIKRLNEEQIKYCLDSGFTLDEANRIKEAFHNGKSIEYIDSHKEEFMDENNITNDKGNVAADKLDDVLPDDKVKSEVLLDYKLA